MNAAETAQALRLDSAEFRMERQREFNRIARLSGPAVSDRQIWRAVDDNLRSRAHHALVVRTRTANMSVDIEAAFDEFDAADRAAGWR